MRLPESVRLRLLGYAQEVMRSRAPDEIINDNYVERWRLRPKSKWSALTGNVYIHRFLGDDSDRALHDHAPDNASLILENDYDEHFHLLSYDTGKPIPADHDGVMKFLTYKIVRRQGDIVFRLAGTPHRISLRGSYVTTMFVQGPRRREWGFHCVDGWKKWTDYVAKMIEGKDGCG